MIKCVKRNDLDINKWDQCIRQSYGGRVYATSYFLDIVCIRGGWVGLVLDDYEAVMPLPLNNTFPFLPRISPPLYAQQLGVFSQNILSSQIVEDFILAISAKYRAVYVQLNDTNHISALPNTEIKRRSNYILSLDIPYEEISKNYSKSLRRNIKLAKKNELYLETIGVEKFITFYLAHTSEKEKKRHSINSILQSLLPVLKRKKEAKLFGVVSKDGHLIAACVILKYQDRITYLLSRSTIEGRKLRAMHLIIDEVIKNNLETADKLDFEGSDIESVAKFFSSFGAVNHPYTIVSYKRLPFSVFS